MAAAGTRFTFRQTGFEGVHAVFVSAILQAGSYKIYGKFLPRVLERMLPDGTVAAEPVDRECDKGGLWKVLAQIGGVIFRTKTPRSEKPASRP